LKLRDFTYESQAKDEEANGSDLGRPQKVAQWVGNFGERLQIQ